MVKSPTYEEQKVRVDGTVGDARSLLYNSMDYSSPTNLATCLGKDYTNDTLCLLFFPSAVGFVSFQL